MLRGLSVALLAGALLLGGCTKSPPCTGDATVCGGVCAELKSDNLNCGACGTACAAGTVCSNGACAVTCAAGLVDCDGSCIDPRTDRDHCGASADCVGASAGVACAEGQLCSGGQCGLTCQAGLLDCNGQCTDPLTSRTHCGASGACGGVDAGVTCTAGQVCSAGTCALSCQAGLTECSGQCADTLADDRNCGGCGLACGAGQVCSGGACATSCPDGEVACGGKCVDPTSDPNYCGAGAACTGGVACGPSASCYQGRCEPLCAAGLVMCNGTCIDPLTSASFCGASGYCIGATAGATCSAAQACVAGLCTPPPCTWTQAAAFPLSTAPTGAVLRSGSLGGQGPAAIYGRTAWYQSADWNVLLIPHGLAASDSVFAVEADVYIPAVASNYRYGAIDPFTTSATASGSLGTCQFMGGIEGALYARAGSGSTVEWWNTAVCAWTLLSSQPLSPAPVGAWHRLRIEGVRTTCHYRLLLDGLLLSTSNVSCDPGGPYLSLFGGGLGQAGQVAWSNLAVWKGSSVACIP